MTTKPSSAPWADEPFRLIPTPSRRVTDTHARVRCASEMAMAHNVIIRGLNAIILQGPNIKTSVDENYIVKDAKDWLFFVNSWVKMVHHHHWVEETYIFPDIEKFSNKPGLMSGPRHQHELFHDGLEQLQTYSSTVKPDDFRWHGTGGMKDIVESFSKPLTDHLYDEIEIFLGLGDLDSKGLSDTWDKAEEVAKKAGGLAMLVGTSQSRMATWTNGKQYDVFPVVLGTADKTFEGGCDFPPLPGVMPYMVKYWFGRGNGAWRFLPCDWWGQPRPLKYV